MKKLLIIIGISVFFLMIAAGAAYNSQIIHVDQLYRNMPSSTCYQSTTDKPHEDAVWNLDECYWFVDDPNIPYELQIVLYFCEEQKRRPFALSPYVSFNNGTHYIDNRDCEWKERGFVSTTPFGYYPRDTTGNYDHCFSYKTDPEYGVKIQNTTHVLNQENCEWEEIGEVTGWEFIENSPFEPHRGLGLLHDLSVADDKIILDKYKDLPQVVAFYAKYDAQSSVREDHVSYFAGSSDAAFIRMNVFFDDDKTLDHIETKCYFQKVLQFEIAQEDIVNSLEKYDCKK